MLEHETLLRDMNPDDMGVFFLMKSKFIVEGKNYPRLGRCDNADFAPVHVVLGTEYENEANFFAPKTHTENYVPSVRHLTKWEKIVSSVPDFYIIYAEFTTRVNGIEVRAVDMRTEQTPSMMWFGRTIFSLLKNLREWSFMVDEPFNSEHPMALYSKKALEVLNPPQDVLDEIDAMPDMHLAKFLKGRDDYREIPSPFPDASENLKNWVIKISEDFAEKPLGDVLGGS
jgi:hypothetical protein